MRGIIWIILLFAAAVVAATTLGRNDGLVSVYWAGWRTDLSLNLFLLCVIAAGFLVTVAAQALSALVTLPRRASEWRALRRERAAHAALRESLAEYFGARYARALKAARKALAVQPSAPALKDDSEFTVLGQLLAAGSLHRLQDRTRRDETLRPVLQRSAAGKIEGRSAEEGARLLAAEWALDDRDAPRALQLLGDLPPGVARRTQALRLKLKAQRLADQPLDALQTARLLAKHQAFTATAAQGLLRSLAFEAIETAHDVDQLRRLWDQFDGAERRDVPVAARAAARAGRLGAPEDARQWLRPFWDRMAELDRDEREQLALALLEATSGIGSDWLPRVEAAVGSFAQDPAVVAAVGAVFAERLLWGKARPLLEQAGAAPGLPATARRRVWRQLAAQARRESDEDRARRCDGAAAELD
jgi:HemY protein